MAQSPANSFDARDRDAVIQRLEDGTFDLIVVGGGVNGAGVAHDAALRGLSVCLIEQRDLAFGTSSRSSKLIHGGLRYLEHYHFKLVFEGTNERAALRKVAPHLVRPLLFALPVYGSSRHPLWKIDIGLWLYDGLSLFKAEKRHVTVRSQKRMLEREPLLNPDGLNGGIIYYDCVTDDARITLENAMAAARLGAPIVTHAQVVRIDDLHAKNSPASVTVRDELSGRHFTVRGRGVVNCTGVWTDRTRALAKVSGTVIRPSKGVHIVFPRERLEVRHAVALVAPQDGRVFFAIPWNGRTVVGTTDTDDKTDPGELRIDLEDTRYLLNAANFAFPSAKLGHEDIIAGWVGLRPLIHVETDSASDVPREHQIYRDGKMVTVAGGKLTTYRRMAAEVVDDAAETIGARCQDSTTEDAKLPGAIGLTEDFDEMAARLTKQASIPEDVASRLANVYGSRADDVARYLAEDRALAERVCPDRDVIMAEVVHAVDRELAVTLDDVLVRRTSLSLTAEDQAVGAAERVADVMANRLGWDAARRHDEVQRFLHSVELARAFRTQLAAEVK